MPEVCIVCGKEYKKEVSDFHLGNEHDISRDTYNTMVTVQSLVPDVVETEDEAPQDVETPSQTPSPEPEVIREPIKLPPPGLPEKGLEPPIEPPFVVPVNKPIPRSNKSKLYKLGPGNRRGYFFDRVTGLRINKNGKSGDKQPLPDVISPAIEQAIRLKLIVPVEDR